MTKQEIFDKVLAHLRAQGHAAMTPAGGCKYLTESGEMCAIGCLIPRDVYDSKMENTSVSSLMIDGYLKRDLLDEHLRTLLRVIKRSGIRIPAQAPLLVALQNAHDDTLAETTIGLWDAQMAGIACDFHLKYMPPPSQPNQ